ncbi:MAG: hypothetical protein QM780_09970 [Hyphomicrobium sp.]|uniref:hypothetical protein n=1 Tax=Hyphomicrobium sp. TaxID=82 RepID=UPI0039E63B2D
MDFVPGLGASLLVAIGVWLLRPERGRPPTTQDLPTLPFAWVAIVAGAAIFAASYGAARGLLYSLLTFSLAGYVAVGSRITLRQAPPRNVAPPAAEPEDRPTNWRRAGAKALLSIVIAGVAAFGLGEAFAIAVPLAPPDRLVLGGLLVPVLWGAGMAWTLADRKLLRAAVALSVIAFISYAIAFAPRALD